MVEAVLPVVEVGLVNRSIVGRLGGSRGWSRRRLRRDGDVFLRSGHCVGAVWGYHKEIMKDREEGKKRVKEYSFLYMEWRDGPCENRKHALYKYGSGQLFTKKEMTKEKKNTRPHPELTTEPA